MISWRRTADSVIDMFTLKRWSGEVIDRFGWLPCGLLQNGCFLGRQTEFPMQALIFVLRSLFVLVFAEHFRVWRRLGLLTSLGLIAVISLL
jgi:hypothetical protein